MDPPSLFSIGESSIPLIQLFLDDPSNKPHFCNLNFFIFFKISKLKIYARIGVYAAENRKPQLLLVTLKFSYKVNKNKNVDHIDNLKSYSEVKHFIKKYIESSRYKTLEKLIIESSKALKKKFRIQNISLEVEKPETAKKYGCLSVSVTK